MTIDSSGRISKPTMPCFYAHSDQGNQTLTDLADAMLETTRYNDGNCYSTSTYRFTAPIFGIYQFNFGTFNNGATGRISFKRNGESYNNQQYNFVYGGDSISMTAVLQAGDYVTVGDWQSISGGTFWRGHSHFDGFLICGLSP